MIFSKILIQLISLILFFNLAGAQTGYKGGGQGTKENNVLKIIGDIPGLQEKEPVVLSKYFHPFTSTSWKEIDSAIVINGVFSIKESLSDGPRLLMLTFPKQKKFAVFMLGNENVRITSSSEIGEMPGQAISQYLRFDGSDVANDFLYTRAIKSFWLNSLGELNSAIGKYRDSTFTRANLEQIFKLMQIKASLNNTVQYLFTDKFYKRRNAAVCEVFTESVYSDQKFDSLWVRVYNNLDEEAKASYYGNLLKEYLELFIGQRAPDFSFSAVNKPGSIRKVAETNKLTILHFWSAASESRQRLHTELYKVYEKYHSIGLEIVSVSLDANSTKWKRAVEEDRIPGYQICDFKEEESEPAKLYKQTPKDVTNILIDQSGKIVAWDVDGPQLYAYLYKIFGQ